MGGSGVVTLLVITVIIMEISQQAPQASPFISSPLPPSFMSGALEHGAPRVGSEPVACRGELGWGGRGDPMDRGGHMQK